MEKAGAWWRWAGCGVLSAALLGGSAAGAVRVFAAFGLTADAPADPARSLPPFIIAFAAGAVLFSTLIPARRRSIAMARGLAASVLSVMATATLTLCILIVWAFFRLMRVC